MMIKILGLLTVLAAASGASAAASAAPIELQTPSGVLYGTLETPRERGPWPVALFLSGSGPTNRDGGDSDCLRLLAESLASRGIASVRYDKRGVGASRLAAPDESKLLFTTYADDAVAWGVKLRGDKRFSALTLIGHSEGSTLALAACATLKAPVVSLAGPGRRAGTILLAQLKTQAPPDLLAQATAFVASLEQGKAAENVPPALAALFRPSVQPYLMSWFRFDPAQLARDLPAPMLVIQGTTDLQVEAQDANLLHQAQPASKMVLIEGMNHTLKEANGDIAAQARAHADPALPLAPSLPEEVALWILSVTKPAPAAQ